MSGQDRKQWDAVYKARAGDKFPSPDPLLLHYAPPALSTNERRTALDLACGYGQNGLWLAEQGYVVDLIDVSRRALVRAQEEAARRVIREVNFLQVDLDETPLEKERYDLICVFRYLQRPLMSSIRAAVKPGGRIIYQTYNTRWLDQRPDFNPDFLLSIGELTGYFSDWRILRNVEPEAVSQIVAIKPERPG